MFSLTPKVEKLAIGYPWVSQFVWTSFAENAMNLQRPSNSRWFRGRGWCPARRHIDICEQAIKWGASHILILGADQVHPEDMIPRLIKRHEEDDCEVISALVPTRGHVPHMDMKPFQPMAWRWKNGDSINYRGYDLDKDKFEVIKVEDGELQRIDMIGSGVLMFPVDDLLMIPKPWFIEKFNEEDYKRQASMDTRFVWELKSKAKANVWVDTTIKVGHINPFIIDDTYQHRFGDWQEVGYGECKDQVNLKFSEIKKTLVSESTLV
jgi:hypothetical protein